MFFDHDFLQISDEAGHDQLRDRITELESELRVVREKMEREQLELAEEKAVAVSEMQCQLTTIATERWVYFIAHLHVRRYVPSTGRNSVLKKIKSEVFITARTT